MIINLIKFPIFVIVFIIAIYFYVYSRKVGCTDDTAMNYNPDANISSNHKCKYHTLGCMDKNAGNYNMFATTSCEEDCIGCEVKGTCDLCDTLPYARVKKIKSHVYVYIICIYIFSRYNKIFLNAMKTMNK